MNSSDKLKQEFKDLYENSISGIGLTVSLLNDDNIYIWRASFIGPRDSYYRNGIFYIKILFSKVYPYKAPVIQFLTPIYHPNVNPKNDECDSLGDVSVNVLNFWKPSISVKEMLTKFYSIFYSPNIYCSYSIEMANEYNQNRTLYDKKVAYFTKKYANPMNGLKNLKQISEKGYWDFSCNENDLNPVISTSSGLDYYGNTNDNIFTLFFSVNGGPYIPIQCKSSELTKDVVQRVIDNCGLKIEKEVLCIKNAIRLNLSNPIGGHFPKNND